MPDKSAPSQLLTDLADLMCTCILQYVLVLVKTLVKLTFLNSCSHFSKKLLHTYEAFMLAAIVVLYLF